MRTKILLLFFYASLAGCAAHEPSQSTAATWVTAWATAHDARVAAENLTDKTVRMVLLPTASGDQLKVRLENSMGQSPVVFSAASIARTGEAAQLQPGSSVRLTFAGKPTLTLSASEVATSDPVTFPVRAFEKLTLSLQVASASDISLHRLGLRINWQANGSHAVDASADGFEPLPEVGQHGAAQWPYYWVSGLDVRSSDTNGTVLLLGDSITDGRCSTRDTEGVNQPDLYQRWGDVLARRFGQLSPGSRKAVANAGIFGNRLLARGRGPSALERLDRDALSRPGLTHVVLFEGTNDISGKFTVAEIIAAMQQAIERIHTAGVKAIGVTVIPRGQPAPQAGWTSVAEAERIALNDWMRHSAPFDGLIDFDLLMSGGPIVTLVDGGQAAALPKAWNCDGTHPNSEGYRAMGEFVDLGLFDGTR